MIRFGDLDLATLRHFEAAVRLGSLSAAAEEGHIAVSAISRRIADMEHLLGVKLLYRAVRGVEPTPAGRLLLSHAVALLEQAGRARGELERFADSAGGVIRVAANPSALNQFLPDEFSEFLAVHPRVRFQVRETVSSEIVRDVRDGQVDIGVFAASVAHDGIETFAFREDTLCVVLAEDHPFAASASLDLAGILALPHIGLEDGSSLFAQVEERARESGGALTVAFRVRSFEAVRRMAAAGLGFGILPRAIAEPYAETDGIAVIALDEPWAHRAFLVGVRERDALSPAAGGFLDFLLQFEF